MRWSIGTALRGRRFLLSRHIQLNTLLLLAVAAAEILMAPVAVAVDFALLRDFLYQQEQVIQSLLVRAG